MGVALGIPEPTSFGPSALLRDPYRRHPRHLPKHETTTPRALDTASGVLHGHSGVRRQVASAPRSFPGVGSLWRSFGVLGCSRIPGDVLQAWTERSISKVSSVSARPRPQTRNVDPKTLNVV